MNLVWLEKDVRNIDTLSSDKDQRWLLRNTTSLGTSVIFEVPRMSVAD